MLVVSRLFCFLFGHHSTATVACALTMSVLSFGALRVRHAVFMALPLASLSVPQGSFLSRRVPRHFRKSHAYQRVSVVVVGVGVYDGPLLYGQSTNCVAT
jgi:hypothetical protein